ncbi:MAG: hypothetical protein LBN99_07685 [Oscillospiraceae bacterium]|jgi:hypothetical protein|nr:hypothetical protein [Oscillospiraceae bacterium]
MFRKTVLLCAAAALILSGAAALAVYTAAAPEPQAAPATELPEVAPPRKYTLRATDGRVTVYVNGDEIPEIVTGIDASGLREYDRALLERGIEVTGYENLLGLIEDFSN